MTQLLGPILIAFYDIVVASQTLKQVCWLTWGQTLLEFLGLLLVGDDQGVQEACASHLELHIFRILLYLYHCNIQSKTIVKLQTATYFPQSYQLNPGCQPTPYKIILKSLQPFTHEHTYSQNCLYNISVMCDEAIRLF